MANFRGDDNANSIRGTNDPDIIVGLLGNDVLLGMGGDDIIQAGREQQLIPDITDDDYVIGDGDIFSDDKVGNDTIYAGYGNDRIYGDNPNNNAGGNDVIYADAGNDEVYAGSGNDILYGGLGNDTLDGGAGGDVVFYNGSYTNYSGYFDSNGSVIITGGEGVDKLTGIEQISFTNGGYFDVLTGDGSNNSLTANPNVWSMLYGGGGRDTLTGSQYNDNLDGSSGRDVLIGGNGSDNLTGGSGADKFRYMSRFEGIDLIKDFSRSQGDKIEIVKSSFGATSLSQFSYNSTTGTLFFGDTHFATLENKPSGFSVQTDLVLV
jgi:Ca2+-binding RTX toxin-like protein